MKIKIFVNDIEAEAELKNTPTARAIFDILPADGAANRWGDEIYFVIPLKLNLEKNADDVVEKGDIAYWPEGCCFCIFFGKTPVSTETEIKAASKVNVFGKIKGDLSAFKNVNNSDLIIVEKD
ncbi:MAG TPA: cyclophilin-like fold protein [Candidatus Nanoarchaeia archaeon]|nr:cyclophilin-like fold protein [Candidatus Nanoarchaeia archaeon]